MKLNETGIVQILPSSLQADENVVHTSKAVTDSVNKVTAETVNELIMSRIDELPEPVVNSLAWQLHVDTYSEDLDIVQKRKLVKNAIKDHKYKGTSWAVKSVVEVLLNYAKVEEWFEYKGSPYHFRVNGSYGPIVNGDSLQSLVNAINEAKNVRSWLDGISFERQKMVSKHLAMPVAVYKEIRIGLPDVGPQTTAMSKVISMPVSIFKEVKVNG